MRGTPACDEQVMEQWRSFLPDVEPQREEGWEGLGCTQVAGWSLPRLDFQASTDCHHQDTLGEAFEGDPISLL